MSDNDQLLKYDRAGAFLPDNGITTGQFEGLAPALEQARRVVVEIDPQQLATPSTIPDEKDPLDAGFFPLPDQLLAEYQQDRTKSVLGRVLHTANRLSETVDRVVVLGIGGSYMGAKAIMDACCRPYFNELDRGRRGGRPRMYFEGNNVDNDAARGLIHLLNPRASEPADAKPDKSAKTPDDRWAMIVISKSGGTLETAVGFRLFLAELGKTVGDNAPTLSELVVPVTSESGKLHKLAAELECQDVFGFPDAVGGRFSVLSPVGLLPAAVLGLDVVRLLEGAAAMNEHFRTAPVGQNAVLDYVGVCHLLEEKRRATIRVLSVWSKALEAVGLWYDQLLAESLGKQEKGATPITAVNTRDLHSRAQQHQEGRRDKLHTNLIVDQWRDDPLAVGESSLNQDELNKHAAKTLPDIMSAAIAGTNAAYRQGGRPTTNLHLPRIDEFSLGQFFQMMMLATVVEGRLIGINPYGQPGVEQYKTNMNRILDGEEAEG